VIRAGSFEQNNISIHPILDRINQIFQKKLKTEKVFRLIFLKSFPNNSEEHLTIEKEPVKRRLTISQTIEKKLVEKNLKQEASFKIDKLPNVEKNDVIWLKEHFK